MLCRVLQESILGSLLFFIYANNLQYALNLLHHTTFGDDTNLFYTDENIKILYETVTVEIAKH